MLKFIKLKSQWQVYALFCGNAFHFGTVASLLFFYYLFDANKVKQMVLTQFNNKNYAVIINGAVEPRSWQRFKI